MLLKDGHVLGADLSLQSNTFPEYGCGGCLFCPAGHDPSCSAFVFTSVEDRNNQGTALTAGCIAAGCIAQDVGHCRRPLAAYQTTTSSIGLATTSIASVKGKAPPARL